MYRLRFAFVYMLVAVVPAVAGVIGWRAIHLGRPVVHLSTLPCQQAKGVAMCVKRQIMGQGAPATMAVYCTLADKGRYLCDASDGAGGCYDIVARRGFDGYPLIESVAQRQC